jgi:hypothetical protein
MPIDPRISLGVQPIQVPDPLAQYGQVQNILAAQAQRQSAGTQNELAQLQLGQARMSMQEVQEAKDVIDKMMAAAKQNGATVSDPMDAAMQMLQHPNPKVREAGGHLFDANQKVLAYQQDKSFINRAAPQPIQATQLPPAPGAQTNFGLNDDSMKAWMADKTTNLDFKPWLEQQNAKQTNALAPTPVAAAVAPAPTNALAATSRSDKLLAEINDLRTRFPYSAKAKEQIALLTKQYEESIKPHVVGANLVSGEGKEIYTGKVKESEFEQLLANSGLSEAEKMALRVARAKKESTHAPPVSVTVSTEKKYGEQFANKMADTDIGKMTTAEKAPQLAESANRIIDLVKQGNLFTGPAADIKLNIARALNVVGASNEEKIANTESLIAASGQSTLDAIKSAGLGTGQGFTDKDLKFLQGIAGGTIDLTAPTLTRLATLQHQAATRSAEAWNSRVKQLPKSVVEGTGLSMEPVKVPPLSPNAMFAVNPKTGERIQSLDGGNTWKPVGGK